MEAPFKVIIIGGGVAGLSLAIMLEAYGFEYDLLEKHGNCAPKLGAGIGVTPNGARILDQIGVFHEMLLHASPVDNGAALSPHGKTVVASSQMGEWLEKLFGYKINFLSRHDCLRILFNKIQRRSSIHLQQEVVKVETDATGKGARVETKDGSVFTGDMVIGADGVRSTVRSQLWRIADAESPGYIPNSDKTGIKSFYTAVIGLAHNPGLPGGGTTRVYNEQRSYFFSEARKGSGDFYWWLCAKNEETKTEILPKLSEEVKQHLLNRYGDDKIVENLTLKTLSEKSVYTAIIPLQEFTLQKCFYKNIVLIGDTFRKLHPVAGQGANSAIEESAFVADILWDLRSRKALRDAGAIENALTEFQSERFARTTALREEAHLVQRMDSLDNGFMRFMAMHAVPRLPFEIAVLPQLGASFAAARRLEHLDPPKSGRRAFSQDMQANIRERSPLATMSWVVTFVLAAFSPYLLSKYATMAYVGAERDGLAQLLDASQIYLSIMAISISSFWVIESYKAANLLSPFVSALLWILASNYWGWERTVPVYLCFNVMASQSIGNYYTPQTMTDLYAAKSLLPALLLIYSVPVSCALGGFCRARDYIWPVAHCALPVVVYLSSVVSRAVSGAPPDIVDSVFGTEDLPYQQQFLGLITGVASAVHVALGLKFGPLLLDGAFAVLSLPVAGCLASLSAVTTLWCLYTAWELCRINATELSVPFSWAIILLATVSAGPAATVTGVLAWSKTALAKATSHQ